MSIPIPSVLERFTKRINLVIPSLYKGVVAYQVNVQSTLVDAYGPDNGVGGAGVNPLFAVPFGGTYASPEIRRRRLHVDGQNYRGKTRAVFDLDEFTGPAAPTGVPSDSQTCFLRIAENHVSTGTFSLLDPILIVPPATFYGSGYPVFTAGGTTPAIASAVRGELPPAGSMHIVTPLSTRFTDIVNLSASDPMYVALGPGVPFREVLPEESVNNQASQVKEIFIASTANVPFSLEFGVSNSL